MRYHHEPTIFFHNFHGEKHVCNHPAYESCTLFQEGGIGFGIIQERYHPQTKRTWWTEIDPWLTDELYLHANFQKLFSKYAAAPEDGIYPVITIRQAMWELKMKPLKKERWETVFDRKPL